VKKLKGIYSALLSGASTIIVSIMVEYKRRRGQMKGKVQSCADKIFSAWFMSIMGIERYER